MEPKPNTICHRCGKQGHEKRTCPHPRPSYEPVDDMCWACGKRGHYTKHCRRAVNNNNNGPYNRHSCCWNCRGVDHKRSDCKNPQVLFCSFCGKLGTTTKSCNCNQLDDNGPKIRKAEGRQYLPEQGRRPEREHQANPVGASGEQPPQAKSSSSMEKKAEAKKPESDPIGVTDLVLKCSLVVSVGRIRYEATLDSSSAVSRINPLAVDLEGIGEYDSEGWVGVNLFIGSSPFYLLFVVDDTMDGNMTLGTDAQLIMDFNVTLGGETIHRPRVLPEILVHREQTQESRTLGESPRFEEVVEGRVSRMSQPSTSWAGLRPTSRVQRESPAKRRTNVEETSDSDSSVLSSYGRYQRGRRN